MVAVALDTDVGTDVDDATALLLLCALPDVELVSVTTVSGQTTVRAALATRLLEHAGRGGVPVSAGSPVPLSSERYTAWLPDGLWLGHEAEGVLSEPEIAAAAAVDIDPHATVDRFAEIVGSHRSPVTVVTIGPLTNLALALERHPDLRASIAGHFAMGGVLTGDIRFAGRRLPPIWEYNFNADREATAQVLEAGVGTTIVPAELTYRSRWSRNDVEALRNTQHPALLDLCALLDIWSPVYARLLAQLGISASDLGDFACHLHDSITVLAATQPDLLDIEEVRLDLVEENGFLLTKPRTSGAFAVGVASAVDVPRLDRYVRDSLLAIAEIPAA